MNVQSYVETIPEAAKPTFEQLRSLLHDLLPNGEEYINYGILAFKVNGKAAIGIGGYKTFISLYPYGGFEIAALHDELKSYEQTKSAVHFLINQPLPVDLIRKIVELRIQRMSS